MTTTLNGPSCSGLIVGDWVAKHVKEGNIVIIPAGRPHGWLEVPVHVDYLSVRPDPDRVLPDDYANRPLTSGLFPVEGIYGLVVPANSLDLLGSGHSRDRVEYAQLIRLLD